MRAYIEGELSRPNNEPILDESTFIPDVLWFANYDYCDELEVSEFCICLNGLVAESGVKDSKFACRWKGVEICYINDNGEYVETEDFTVDEFVSMIYEKNFTVINMEAYYDGSTNVKITSLVLCDKDNRYSFDTDTIDEIEFISCK